MEEKIPKKYIMYLERDDLIKLCAKIEQPTNGNNDDLIAKLQRKIKYCHLTKPMLVAIARPLGIPASETKDNIINKLVEEKKSKKIVSQLQQITITESKGKAKEKDNKKEQEKEKTTKETSPHKSKEKVSEKGKLTPLSVERWNLFRRVELAMLCESSHLPVSRTKGELIEQLRLSGFGLEDLRKVYLLYLCAKEGKTFKKRNSVSELLDILQAKSHPATTPEKEEKKKVKEKQNELTMDFAKPVKMTKAVYRTKMLKLGLVESDQDVFHIVAHANGGADHADNYAFLMGSSFNRFIGNRFDHINCYIVGRSKARKAVEISVQLTSYKGPSADELYTKGKKEFNQILKELDSKK